jgi:hypothetical protein
MERKAQSARDNVSCAHQWQSPNMAPKAKARLAAARAQEAECDGCSTDSEEDCALRRYAIILVVRLNYCKTNA